MKVLFFDIDGVFVLRERYTLEPECLQRLKEIVDATGAILIMSSSWRYYKKHCDSAIKQMKAFGLKVAGFTEDDWDCATERWNEIQSYLDTHPETTRFAVIDDCIGAKLPHAPETFFHTKWERENFDTIGDDGLSEQLKESIITHLNSNA